MDTFLQDLRYAARTLLKNPGFSAIAVVTLALGIGANTAIFSVVNAAMLRPLPYREPHRLMQLYLTVQRGAEPGIDSTVWSYPKFETMRGAQRSFQGVAAYWSRSMNLTGTGNPQRLNVETVSGNYFDVLGVKAVRGRTFVPEEDATPGTHPVVVLSEGIWQRQFGADPALIGRTVELNKMKFTVVGIAPQRFAGLSGAVDLWIPMAMAPATAYPEILSERWSHMMDVVGRLRPEATTASAAAEMVSLGRVVDEAHPGRGGAPATWRAASQPMRDARTDPLLRRSVLVLFGAVSFVLLIACVNVGNLLLARAAARQREVALRVALGAGRARIVSQMLGESVLLALAGGLLGLVVALWGIDLLTALRPEALADRSSQARQFLDFSRVQLDATVLGFTVLLSLASGLLFGLVPALRSARTNLTSSLKQGGLGAIAGGSLRRPNARSVLVAGDVALSLVLLIGAGLMLKSFARARGVDAGFDPSNVLTFRMELPADSIYTSKTAPAVKAQLVQRLSAIPGVEAVSVDRCAPLSGRCGTSVVTTIEGRPAFAEGSEPAVGVHMVGPDYFKVMRTTLVSGRVFSSLDRTGAPRVVLLNETAARRLFPNENPIGKRIAAGVGYFYEKDSVRTAEVVGVVGDVRYGAITDEVQPDVYLPALAYTNTGGTYFLRTRGDPTSIVGAVRREVQAFDKDLPIYDVKTMEELVGGALSTMRFGAFLLGTFASIALLLATIGIYGVMAYSVTQRVREIGIRMALGAGKREVLSLVVGQGLVLALIGVAIGLGSAFALTRILSSLLYGVSPTDPLTFAGLAALLAVVAGLASYLPARRAARVDPMVALRYE